MSKLSHTIYWRSPFSILGMVELFANSGDPDQTPRSAASDLSALFARYPFWGLQSSVG